MIMCLIAVTQATAIGSPSPSTAQSSAAAKTPVADQKLGDGPVDFRCDNLSIFTKPNRNVCHGNVVIRRGDMLICCQEFEGKADDNWAWESFTCSQDVRAQRGVETVWADKADFLQSENDLILTGRPVLHRGESVLEGERVVIDVREDHARITKPRGRMAGGVEINNSPVPQSPPLPTGPLPAKCPLPAIKR
jgi:lipopolysaccharide export system protein LptA